MDFQEKSFDTALETSKLLITLSTAVIAFLAAAINVKSSEATRFTPNTVTEKWLMIAALTFLVVAVGCGVWTQLAITDVVTDGVGATQAVKDAKSAMVPKIKVPFRWQIGTFAIGVGLMATYAGIRVYRN